jgi:hypothetical protein
VNWARAKLWREFHALFTSINNPGASSGYRNNIARFKHLRAVIVGL